MFICKVSGRSMRLEDLPMAVWAQIEKETGTAWSELYIAPAKDPVGGPCLVRKVAEHLGVDVPDTDQWGPRQLLEAFELSKDDSLPSEYREGIPLAEDATTTPGSSGP